MAAAAKELYLHTRPLHRPRPPVRASVRLWVWLPASHAIIGAALSSSSSSSLPFFNEIAFDGDWTDGRTDHITATTRREREREVVAPKLMEWKKPLLDYSYLLAFFFVMQGKRTAATQYVCTF